MIKNPLLEWRNSTIWVHAHTLQMTSPLSTLKFTNQEVILQTSELQRIWGFQQFCPFAKITVRAKTLKAEKLEFSWPHHHQDYRKKRKGHQSGTKRPIKQVQRAPNSGCYC